VGKFGVGGFADADGGAGALGQFAMAGDEVGVKCVLDYVSDSQAWRRASSK